MEKYLEFLFKNPYPRTDVGYDDKGNLYIDIEVPGFNKEDINVEMKGNILVIEGKCPTEEAITTYLTQNICQKDFRRSLELGSEYLDTDIIAQITNGILTITIPKKEAKSTKIEVK